MKSDFIIMLFAIGTVICATYAAPANSEIQDSIKVKELFHLIDQTANSAKSQLAESKSMNMKEVLELLKDIAKLQQNNDDNDNENALADNMGEMATEKEYGVTEEDQAQLSIPWFLLWAWQLVK